MGICGAVFWRFAAGSTVVGGAGRLMGAAEKSSLSSSSSEMSMASRSSLSNCALADWKPEGLFAFHACGFVTDVVLDVGFCGAGTGRGGLLLDEEVAPPFEMAGGLKGRFVAAVAPTWEG